MKVFSAVLLLGSVVFLLTGCSDEKPLDQEKFIEVYYDILVLQESRGMEYSAMQIIREDVYKKHGITHAQYEATIKYLSEDTKRWEEFFDKMIAYVRVKEKAAMGSNSNKEE
ncbi:MAG: DUF4296 domain-containing protein [Ignavibacteriaceae bacterium]|nr:DUF4296 domain-containing protein [Ignavibacteriaceae bacterium]